MQVGVAGRHAGEPVSIAFFDRTGVDFLVCAPQDVPAAKVAAAQATIRTDISKWCCRLKCKQFWLASFVWLTLFVAYSVSGSLSRSCGWEEEVLSGTLHVIPWVYVWSGNQGAGSVVRRFTDECYSFRACLVL